MIALETKWFAVTDWAGVHHHHVSQLEGEGGRWRWRGGAGLADGDMQKKVEGQV